MNFQLLSLFWDNLSIDCLKKRESSWIYSYQMCFVSRFHQQKQKYFLGGGSIKLRKCFTTLLAITRLLDFEVTTLPYPTRSWKTTTRWSLLVTRTTHPYVICHDFASECAIHLKRFTLPGGRTMDNLDIPMPDMYLWLKISWLSAICQFWVSSFWFETLSRWWQSCLRICGSGRHLTEFIAKFCI